jgi:hypothetical protein
MLIMRTWKQPMLLRTEKMDVESPPLWVLLPPYASLMMTRRRDLPRCHISGHVTGALKRAIIFETEKSGKGIGKLRSKFCLQQ